MQKRLFELIYRLVFVAKAGIFALTELLIKNRVKMWLTKHQLTMRTAGPLPELVALESPVA